jgi:hypothetical protein
MRRAIVALVAGSLLLAGQAQAERMATPSEIAAWGQTLNWPAECLIGTVSTVDGTWGLAWRYHLPVCPDTGDGFDLMHEEADGSWSDSTAASDQLVCGTPVPRGPGRDLLLGPGVPLCRSSMTLVACSDGELSRIAMREPKRCDTLGPRQSFAEGANLAGLHWWHWGRPTASARAREVGYHGGRSIRARVVAFRRRSWCGGPDRIYTRLRVTTRYGGGIIRLPACP